MSSGGAGSGAAGGNGGATGGSGGGSAGRGGGSGSTAGAGAGGNAGRGGTGGGAGAGTGGRGGSGATGGSGGLSGLLVPAQGALLGAFVGTGTIPQLETTLGRKLAISHNFYGWTDDWTTWVRSTAQAGYIPLITWEAWTNGSVGIPLDDIINGAHDTMIRSRAQSALAVGQKFFLRWGHEMNGNWYPWDGFHNGASTAANAKYISAYRHIHDLFTAAGASNVLWVFSPNVDSVPGDAWNQWANYYPGDAYVDWMAFDGYNWGTVMTTSTWRTFPSMTSTIYAGLAAKGKPIMIPETASAEQGGDKAAWIAAILPALNGSFPSIKALVWFHMNKETDWRVDSSAAARTSFVQMANDPYFNP
jgi:beta-mannanase